MGTKELPSRFSRRWFLKAGGAAVLVLTFPAVGLSLYKVISEDKTNTAESKSPQAIAEGNFKKTLEEMLSSKNQEVKEFAQDLSSLTDDRKIGFIDSGSSIAEFASVTITPTENGREAMIVLSIDKFTSSQFSQEEAAISLFEAFYVYQKAQEVPYRFTSDASWRNQLKEEAKNLSLQIFSQSGTR